MAPHLDVGADCHPCSGREAGAGTVVLRKGGGQGRHRATGQRDADGRRVPMRSSSSRFPLVSAQLWSARCRPPRACRSPPLTWPSARCAPGRGAARRRWWAARCAGRHGRRGACWTHRSTWEGCAEQPRKRLKRRPRKGVPAGRGHVEAGGALPLAGMRPPRPAPPPARAGKRQWPASAHMGSQAVMLKMPWYCFTTCGTMASQAAGAGERERECCAPVSLG